MTGGTGAPSVVSGFPPDGRLFRLSEVNLRIAPGDHPSYLENRAEIEANWQAEVARNPALFSGALVFQRQLSLIGDRVEGLGHVVPYSTHLWWRKHRDRARGAHSFAWAVPVSSDGAVIAIRMGPRTANAGVVYCAAGSLEPEDISDGRVNVDLNMRREVLEETGLDLAGATGEAGYRGFFRDNTLLIARVFRFPLTAEEIIERVRHHMIHDHEQEIDDVIAIRRADPADHRYNAFMPTLLAGIFEEAARTEA